MNNSRVAALTELSSEHPPINSVSLAPERGFLEPFRKRSFRRASVGELFHEASKVTAEYERRRQWTEAELSERGLRPALEMRNPERESMSSVPLGERGSEDGRPSWLTHPEGASCPITPERVGRLLSRAIRDAGSGRPYASAGEQYPVEVYLAGRSEVTLSDQSASRTWFYAPDRHELVELEASAPAVYAAADDSTADLLVCLSAVFPRVRARYGTRGHRYALVEAGAVAQTLRVVAHSLGLRASHCFEYRDHEMDDAFGLNGVDESIVLVLAVDGE